MLPRLLADWLAVWRDLPRHPRQVLLNRSHLPASAIVIVACMVVDWFAGSPWSFAAVCVAAIVGGPTALAGFIGAVAHCLWDRGLIWQDTECEFCRDPGDEDDDDPEPFPDDPDDPHGIARDAAAMLRSLTSHAPAR